MSWVSIGIAGAQIATKVGTEVSKSRKAKKDRELLLQESPQRRAFMEDISSMRKAYQQGTAYQPQINQLKSQQATTNEGIIQAVGGNVGAAVTGLTRAGKLTQDATADMVAAGDKTVASLLGVEGEYADAQAKKREDLALMSYAQNKGDAAEAGKTAAGAVSQASTSGALEKILKEVIKKRKKGDEEEIDVEGFGGGSIGDIGLGDTPVGDGTVVG